MKKYIAILISIIPLLLCLITYQFLKSERTNLAGTKLNDFLYAYKIKDSNENLMGLNIKNNEIYFLTDEEINQIHNYKLYSRNIYNKKNKLIKEFTKEDTYCNLINNYIQCTDNKIITLYNYDLKNIYEIKINTEDEFPKIVPYKDTFIKIENNNLYIAQNQKEHVLRELPEYFQNAYVENYYFTKDNTYLLLNDVEKESYYIYDINKKTFETIKSKNNFVYEKGFYFYDKDKYTIVDKKDSEVKEYKNAYQNEYHYPSVLLNNNTLYQYNITDKILYITDLEKNNIVKVPLDIKDNIINLYLDNEFLYIECDSEANNLYLIKIEDIKNPIIKIDDELAVKEKEINNKKTEIKNKYNVTINTKEETNINYPDFTIDIETNNDKITDSITKITKILDKFSKEYFDSFYDEINEGLNIYLTSTLTPSDTEKQISNPAAYSLNYQNKYMIVIDINEPNIEELLCHELMHNTELSLKKDTVTPFNDWNKFNPTEFEYNNSYTSPYKYNYTLNEKDKNNVYFIDEYSHTYEMEDRARVFENICSLNTSSIILEYPNLLAKGQYLEEEYYKYYPSLKNTTLFQSLKQ